MRIFLLLTSLAFGAADRITYPYDFTTIPSGTRGALQSNYTAAKTAVDHHADSLDLYLSGKGKIGTGKVVYSIAPTLTNLLTVDSINILGAAAYTALTASKAVFTDANKALVSINVSGSGSVVMSSGATIASPTLTGTITNSGTISGGTVNATTLQQGGVQAVTTTGTQTLTNKSIVASQITAGTFGSGNYTITDGLFLTGTGLDQATLSPTTNGPSLNVATSGFSVNSGGMITFGASGSSRFAGIKGALQDGGGNTAGSLSFSTRRTTSDATLTEAFRIAQSGLVSVSEKLGVANFSPDSTLTVTGSGNFSGNLKAGGRLAVNGATSDSTLAVIGSGRYTGNVKIDGNLNLLGTMNSNSTGFYEEGSYVDTVYANGSSTGVPINISYVRVGKVVTLTGYSSVGCAGNDFVSIRYTASSMPSTIKPSSDRFVSNCSITNASGASITTWLKTDGVIVFNTDAVGTWLITTCTTSSFKVRLSLTYRL